MRLALLALLACLPAVANASAVVIWPIDPTIRAGEQATALWLDNKGDAPVTVQVRAFGWSQPDGEDRLDAQQAVVASPPIATVAPGARQLVRIIRRTPGAAPESAYRLMIDELPPPPAEPTGGPPQARLAVQMRYSIPLFTYVAAATDARLDARISQSAQGRILSIRNTGTLHARLTDLRLEAHGRAVSVRAGLARYVLPGATIVIPLPGNETGTVKVAVNGIEQTLGPIA